MQSMDLETQKQLGITQATVAKLAKMQLHTLWDLALHLPLRYEDETYITPIAEAPLSTPIQVEGIVCKQEILFRPRRQLLVQIRDEHSDTLILRFIHFYPNQQKQMAEGKKIRALGEIKHGFFGDEIIHPKIKSAESQPLARSLTPIYPTVNGLKQATLQRIIQLSLNLINSEDWLPEAIRQQLNLPNLLDSLHILHSPPPEIPFTALTDKTLDAWQRLKFDELLAQQISVQLARSKRNERTAPIIIGHHQLSTQLLSTLPFQLTAAQQRVVSEIQHDLAQSKPMYRLLQGDVGSGKTIVAALCAITAIEAGFQVALMAPTEILAEQHFHKLSQWLTPLGIQVKWLSGSLKKREKEATQLAIETGTAQLIIGTHALFQNHINFAQLGLSIVDEQHRFGVAQRLALKNKGKNVHQLMMSATPIPRSLFMSYLADLDVSIIDELPPGRTPIKTKLINSVRRKEVEHFVRHIVQQGQQVYWVCPLIEESETLQLQTATDTHATLTNTFSDLRVGLVHGKLKPADKANIMQQFTSGQLDILVATTVIEVGVDVPNASLMVIEHAERMGLAQLHQLRGRIGRGVAASTCILLFTEPLSMLAKARLKVIYEHTDGFQIAQQDLAIRGPGEFLGARQSGIPVLRFANLDIDTHLLEAAKNVAPDIISQHPQIAEQYLHIWFGSQTDFLDA